MTKQLAAPGVVVGFDGSHGARLALDWAVQQAVGRSSPLTVVRAWDVPAYVALNMLAPTDEDLAAVQKETQRELERQVNEQLARHPRTPAEVNVRAEYGRPVQVLGDLSGNAQLLVVGRHGSGFVRMVLGSTAAGVLRLAACPVAVVPEGADERAEQHVVVGWDGPDASEDALLWAAQEALRRETKLVVLFAWQLASLHQQVLRDLSIVPPITEYEEAAHAEAESGAAVAERVGVPRDQIDVVTVHASATHALLDASKSAGLVVVGSRGRGGFPALLLGSTSDQLARHAPAPVVVVPSRTSRRS